MTAITAAIAAAVTRETTITTVGIEEGAVIATFVGLATAAAAAEQDLTAATIATTVGVEEVAVIATFVGLATAAAAAEQDLTAAAAHRCEAAATIAAAFTLATTNNGGCFGCFKIGKEAICTCK